MAPLSDSELIGLLDDLESDRVERKQFWSADASDKGCQAICAFANDLPDHRAPGVLFVGAKDDGQPSGLPITDELLNSLGDVRSNGNIVPPPTMSIEKRMLKGSEMAVVMVSPAESWAHIAGVENRMATEAGELAGTEKKSDRTQYGASRRRHASYRLHRAAAF